MLRVALAVCFSLLLAPWAAFAEPARTIAIREVRVGIAGAYKPGLWTPVEVLLSGGETPVASQVVVTAPDGDGVPTRYSTPADQPVSLQPDKEASATLFVRLGRHESTMNVEVVSDGTTLAERAFEATPGTSFPPAISSRDALVVVVGPDAMPLERVLKGSAMQRFETATVVRIDRAEQLPSRWHGYEGVDSLVLSSSDPQAYRGLDARRTEALQKWIRMGGSLILSAGRNAEETIGPSAPLVPFVPGTFQRTLPLRQTNSLETYAGGQAAVPRNARREFRVAQIDRVSGIVEAAEGGLPLVVRRTDGFGMILFTAFDLDQPPISDWKDCDALVARLLDITPASAESAVESGEVMHYGFDDLAGQLRSALDQFPGVRVVPFWAIVAILAVYLALIGPGDYFFLRRVLGRMRLTWVTFSIVVAVFCVAAYFVAHRLKGDRVLVNQVDLVDFDAATGDVRGTSWANLFSPKVDRYDLRFAPKAAHADSSVRGDLLVGWMGLPGEGLGGMSPRAPAPSPWKRPYEVAPSLDNLSGVPLQVWSTKSFTARWSGKTDIRVPGTFHEEARTLYGTVTNQTGSPLRDGLLCYGRWAYVIGTLEPGQSATIDGFTERRELKTFLTGRRFQFDKGREVSTPYDRSSVDEKYILQAMMFFKAAGGSRYTGLVNRYQGFIDMSDLLQTGHAVLVATPGGEAPAAELLRDGQPLAASGRHQTVYRFVYPVKPSSDEQDQARD